MKLKELIILLLLTIVFPVADSYAATESVPRFSQAYWVSNISMNDGLSHNFVDDIYRDSKGFVWIATSGSLSRYDGYEFVNFKPNSPAHYIKSNFVRKVAEDRHRRMWVASDGGIDVIDLRDLHPMEPDDATGMYSEISTVPSGYVSTDNEGNVWIRNEKDVLRIEFDDAGAISGVAKIPHDTESVVTTFAVKPVGKGMMLTSIGGKVCNLSYANGKIFASSLAPELEFEKDIFVSDYVEREGEIWVSTEVGLFRHNPATKETTIYHGAPGVPGMLNNDFSTTLAVTEKGVLIVGSLNGIYEYVPASDKFITIEASDINPMVQGLNNSFINCLLVEDSNLWVGTEGCGVNLFSPRNLFADMMRHDPHNPGSLSCNPVNAIFEDGDGTLWIGTVEGGLNRATGGDMRRFDHYTKESGVLSHNSVSAITADHEGHLWVGTWGGGVNVLDRSMPQRPGRVLNATDDGLHRVEYIGTLVYDPFNNMIWIGANSGLYVYDIKRDELKLAFPEAMKVKGSAGAVVSPDGRLWICCLEGLFIVDLKGSHGSGEFSYSHHPNKLDAPNVNVREKLTCVAIAHDGTVWVGSNGNGVYRREVKDGKEAYVNYNTSDGLPNDNIHGIAEDPQGNIWIATYHGLSCLKTDGRFVNFGCNDGLDTEQFYWNATQRLANGHILFGSVDGLVDVKGLAPEKKSERGVVFTSFAVGGDKSYGNLEKSSLSESEKSFEVGFSALDYAGASNGRYFYRMNGFDNEWKELPAGRHSVNYTNLSNGNYTLQVKYVSPGQSVASAPVSEFNIEVVPVFYKRKWFIILVVLMVLAAVWSIYRWRVGDLTKQRNQLKAAVDEGVKEINEQKSRIEDHALELQRQNEELKLRNEQISEQKMQLSQMAHKVQKMTVDRISFFTNITHEFRTPITLIIGPIERALKLSTNPKVIEQLNFVERNSKYLLSLVNQLMDFRKLESGKMDIVINSGNFRKFIDELIPPFKAYAEERGIEIKTVCHLTAPVFKYDEDAIRKVLINLLGNAIKFTPDNGCITLYIALFKSGRCAGGRTLYISVSDTGSGIPEEDIDKVFNRFYQGKSQIKYPLIGSSDSGIGLYLCRKIVEVYGGSISVCNNRRAGCTFRVVVPVADDGIGEDLTLVEGGSGILESQASDVSVSQGSRLTILVVEDNADMRAFMRSILSDYYNLLEAENGEEALKLLSTSHVDFIISDLMMPVMDGLTLSRRVKENFTISHIPFLMLTAKTAGEARLEGYRSGVDDYILKPFDEEMLLARIRNILENKRRYQRQFVSDMEVDRLNIGEESRDKKFVDKVMEVVRQNYRNSYFEVGDFAEALGVSRSLLNKKLQSLVGQSASQLMRSYRMKLSRELIIRNRDTKSMNISEIAFEVGFNDSKYFTRCFTKHFGVSPSAMLKNAPVSPAGEEVEE